MLALSDLHTLLDGLLGQYHALLFEPGLPKPRGILWAAGLRGTDSFLDSLDTPLRALLLVLLITLFALLGTLLDPSFRLLKPPGENRGEGPAAHLEPRQLARAALAAGLSLWLLGAFLPLAYLLPPRSPGLLLLAIVLSGVGGWVLPAGEVARPLLQSVLLTTLLWTIWGPGGVASGLPRKGNLPRTAGWGLMAGGAAAPAIAALFIGRAWIAVMAPAFSLTDPAGWRLVFLLTIGVPLLACVALLPVVLFYRPQAGPRPVTPLLIASGVVLALTALGTARAGGALRRLDVGVPSLRRLLGLTSPALPRIAVVVGPDGRPIPSTTADGSENEQGGDSIAVNQISCPAVDQFLARRNYRSRLTQRAFTHLFVCDSLDWITTEQLRLCLRMLEHAPSTQAAKYLLEKLADCPSTPENREVLDALADPARFDWPDRKKWLGVAYLRFGEAARARDFLLHAGLNEAELRQSIGGLPPLADGIIRGRVLFGGTPRRAVRLGLIRADADTVKLVSGICRPVDWRCVSASAYSGKDGNFEFRHIPEGKYVLILTSVDMGRTMGRVAVFRGPGVIELDQVHPVRTLAPFDVEFPQPVRAPVRARPGITASVISTAKA